MKAINLTEDEEIFSKIRLVVFQIPGDQNSSQYAMNAHKIREVIEYGDVEKLPDIYYPYVAIKVLRGIPVPILNLSLILSAKGQFSAHSDGLEFSNEHRIIICETLGRLVGIIVDKFIKINEFSNEDISALNFETGQGQSSLVNGIIQSPMGLIYLINIEEILEGLEGDKAVKDLSKEDTIYSGKTILIVEDSRLYQKKLVHTFKQLGFKVHLAENGKLGLQKLNEIKHVDLIFTDIEMPELNGIEMVRQIKQMNQYADIPIVFHSSISSEGLIKQLRDDNLGSYINKFDQDVILAELRKYFK